MVAGTCMGPWQTDGILNAGDIVVDGRRRLWVTEMNFTPKRISVWNLADGKFVREFYGPTHYGASGAAISPIDPNLLVSEGCEWRIDPVTGEGRCVGVFSPAFDQYAVYCTPAGRRLVSRRCSPD